MNFSSSIKAVKWLKIIVLGLLLVSIYYDIIPRLVTREWQKKDFTYSYFIPIVILYLLWEKRQEFLNLPSRPSWIGFVPLALGIFIYLLGELGGVYMIIYISIWFMIVGLCWIQLGWRKLWVIFFPICLILTTFPPPKFLVLKITFQLKLISSQIGVKMLHLCGISAYREGNIIDLGFTQLQVVDACSGLRYLIPLILLGLLLAYFFKASLWKRAMLVVSTVPISIFVNSLRIAAVGVLYPIWGKKVAEGFFHDFSGWFIFMGALAMLLFEMWIINKIFPGRSYLVQSSGFKVQGKKTDRISHGQAESIAHRVDGKEEHVIASRRENGSGEELNEGGAHQSSDLKPQSTGGSASDLEPLTVNPEPAVKKGWRSFFHPPQFVVAVVLLSATLALSHGVEFREKIPIAQSFDGFPMRVGEWRGIRQIMEQEFVDELDLSDYVIVDYQNNQKKNVNFYVAYYESQRKGESIHTPATCLPGTGWIFKQAGGVSILLKDHNPETMTVNRAFMQQRDYKQLCYYWFPKRGRILTNAYELKFYTFWDALIRQRTDGALVRVITPVYEEEELEDAENRLQEFVGVINPVLSEYLPE